MLDIQNIYKTFNPGTVNEKRALHGASPSIWMRATSSP